MSLVAFDIDNGQEAALRPCNKNKPLFAVLKAIVDQLQPMVAEGMDAKLTARMP